MTGRMDWEGNDSEILLNPSLSESLQHDYRANLLKIGKKFPKHLWLATSGSTEKVKFVAISKEGFLLSAKAVNHHLNSHPQDRWLNPLPIHHVGGLSIWARGWLSKAAVYTFEPKWNPFAYVDCVKQCAATLSSLVPTQVYDLIKEGISAPRSLRSIIVGGGALSDSLYQRALELGWPLLLSYGLTECSSQVATSTLANKALQVLPHVEVKINQEGCICLKSPSLLTTYVYPHKDRWESVDPKQEGWLVTQDLGVIEKQILHFKGRVGDQVKIGGELVSLFQLETILEKIRISQNITIPLALFLMPDERLGHVVNLAAEGNCHSSLTDLIQTFNQTVLPFERIREIHFLNPLPLSSLGKPKKKDILEAVLVNGKDSCKIHT